MSYARQVFKNMCRDIIDKWYRYKRRKSTSGDGKTELRLIQ